MADLDRSDPDGPLEAIRRRTPARILVGRAGPAYRTETQLALRLDHAAALDAVHAELDLARDLGPEFVDRWGVFEVASQAGSKAEYLMRPDLGRRLAESGRDVVTRLCPPKMDLQVIFGDGLSAAAVVAQVPDLLPLLEAGAGRLGWTFGRPFFVRHCRVGVLNDLGEWLGAEVVVLLIGERPGLATAESLSAYMAYRPGSGQTDAHRNLISNIHARGLNPEEAARRIIGLAGQIRRERVSGVGVKEDLGCPALPDQNTEDNLAPPLQAGRLPLTDPRTLAYAQTTEKQPPSPLVGEGWGEGAVAPSEASSFSGQAGRPSNSPPLPSPPPQGGREDDQGRSNDQAVHQTETSKCKIQY